VLNPLLEANNFQPTPCSLITTFENVAVPPAAATVCGKVPEGLFGLPVIGLNAVDNLTLALLVVALPNASWIATVIAGEFATPLIALLGCCVKTSFDGLDGVTSVLGWDPEMVNGFVLVVPPMRPPAVDEPV
jgi:hypothetical protein